MIPPMTDPMGKHWEQPSVDRILVDETHAMMSQRTLDELADYSCTQPTGVYKGKMWKRRKEYLDESKGWWLCWYGPSEKGPEYCSVNVRSVIVI